MDAQKHLFDNKKMAALLIPLAIDQLLNSFMGTVDTLVVSNLGSAAISAVTLVDSINILIVHGDFQIWFSKFVHNYKHGKQNVIKISCLAASFA